MSVQDSVVALLQQAQTAAVANVNTSYTNLIAAVQALPADPTASSLQQQITALNAQIASAQTALASDETQIEAMIAAVEAALAAPAAGSGTSTPPATSSS